jgi:hypothetical protein
MGSSPAPCRGEANIERVASPRSFPALRRADNKTETAMAENAWTHAEESMLVTGFHAGIKPEHMADALRKTPGSVRWKLNQMGLTTLPCAPPGTAKPQYDEQSLAVRRGDLAFKRAMLFAIKAGAERAQPVVIKSRASRYVRRVTPSIESGYRSSAGYTADMGTETRGARGSR